MEIRISWSCSRLARALSIDHVKKRNFVEAWPRRYERFVAKWKDNAGPFNRTRLYNYTPMTIS